MECCEATFLGVYNSRPCSVVLKPPPPTPPLSKMERMYCLLSSYSFFLACNAASVIWPNPSTCGFHPLPCLCWFFISLLSCTLATMVCSTLPSPLVLILNPLLLTSSRMVLDRGAGFCEADCPVNSPILLTWANSEMPEPGHENVRDNHTHSHKPHTTETEKTKQQPC